MTKGTKDNLGYLAIGLAVALLVVVDFVSADRRGGEMWWPTDLQFHAGAYLLLLAYFIARETRRLGATPLQIIPFEIGGALLHFGIVFLFRSIYGGPLGVRLFLLALAEFFVVVEIMRQVARRLKSRQDLPGS